VSNFFAAGGIQLDADPIDPAAGSFTPGLAARLGERAVAVEVGTYGGVLVWADPLVNGVRTHNLYWSDDAYNYSLIADVSAEKLVALGRSLVCGGFGA